MKHLLLAIGGITALASALAFPSLASALVFGWAFFLGRTLPEVAVRSDGLIVFVLGIAVFTMLLHWICTWFRDDSKSWRWRSTLLIVGCILMMFIAGIAMVGVTHQATWLAGDPRPHLVPALPKDPTGSSRNLRMIGIAVANQQESYDEPISEFESDGHSWTTRILPFLGYQSEIDSAKTWDHPDNKSEASKLVPELLNPGIRPVVLRDENGYGVSHYAANQELFDGQPDFIGEETANRLFVGEVASNFQPWAKPDTHRDASLGINRSPNGFGGPAGSHGALFLMGDGRVQFFSQDTDPKVLKSLSTAGKSGR